MAKNPSSFSQYCCKRLICLLLFVIIPAAGTVCRPPATHIIVLSAFRTAAWAGQLSCARNNIVALGLPPLLLLLLLCLAFFSACSWLLSVVIPAPCYLVDFCCTEAEGNASVTVAAYTHFMSTWRSVKQHNLSFQHKILLRSGIGEESYAPPRLIARAEDVSMEDARMETENLMAIAAKRLLEKVAVEVTDIDIVVVNSSLFNPSPSLAAVLVNTLKMRSNVKSFNLAGMGCSAGLLAVDLARNLLRVHHNSYALVVSTENITSNMYFGNNDRSMMVSNALFRCGCAALLLSSKRSSYGRSKLQLLHCVRTHIGSNQKAYECVQHLEDDEGKLGVSLQLSLVEVAGIALRANITKLAPLILPLDELARVIVSLLKSKLSMKSASEVYVPSFKRAIDHFCIHPGGRAVIDAIGKGLKLSNYDTEPGRMALSRFGNTSSSGIWYALAYCEAKGRLKKGDKVWQIALGSGFKCNSGVWRVLRDIERSQCGGCNPWMSSINRYPPMSSPIAIAPVLE